MRRSPPGSLEQAQVRQRGGRRAEHEVDGAGIEVAAVQLGVGAPLLDDEDVHPQAQQPVQRGRRQIGPPHHPHRAVHVAENLAFVVCGTTT